MLERRHAEGLRDDRNGRIEDGGVERLHEKGDGDQPRQKPLARC